MEKVGKYDKTKILHIIIPNYSIFKGEWDVIGVIWIVALSMNIDFF